MCSNFECFVSIGDTKHTISIDCDINCVTFSDVFFEILKIDSKTKISFETHIFEIFDFDINSFVRIISSNQLIKYLSRIRVSPKTTQNTDNSNTKTSNERRTDFTDAKRLKSQNNCNYNKNDIKSKDNTHLWTQSQHEKVENKTKMISHKEDINPEIVAKLKNSAIVLIEEENKIVYIKCYLCDIKFSTVSEALIHIQSVVHIKHKNEQMFSGIDSLIVMKSETINDIEVVLARREALKCLEHSLKEKFVSHGIKINDGFGVRAYVCTKCNLFFDTISKIQKHLQEFDKIENNSIPTGNTSSQTEITTYDEYITSQFRNEGIKSQFTDKWKRNKSNKNKNPDYYYCVYCKTNFFDKQLAINHINTDLHKCLKCCEHLSDCDKEFVTESNKMSDFGTHFARSKALRVLSDAIKSVYIIEDIRLKDGIGSDAYVCLKCNVSIEVNKIEETIYKIDSHIKTREHTNPYDPYIQVIDLT